MVTKWVKYPTGYLLNSILTGDNDSIEGILALGGDKKCPAKAPEEAGTITTFLPIQWPVL